MKTRPFLGLEIRATRVSPGETATFRELAIWITAGGEKITWQRVQQIHDRSLRKLRIAFMRKENLELREAAIALFRQ